MSGFVAGQPFVAISAEITIAGWTMASILAGPRLRTRRSYASVRAGVVLDAGFELLATFSAPHYSVVLPSYSVEATRLLSSLLGEAQKTSTSGGVIQQSVLVTLRADVNQVDETGYVWAFLSDADEPDRVRPGALIVAGDSEEPFMAHVVDVVEGPEDDHIVHLDVVGVPEQAIDELRHARLITS